ncbi:hypothetical protein KEM64_15085 [Bacillus velezensis]|uniref:hypothetical protein n=1 Tax=Bacillus velezensis TaxID=492670 RepID=UPI0010FAD178|nr:hypothetical protein [Bacillus velezensis]QUS12827.1 hypothetical protein KEM64_15085 [Bacillus velezensis]TKZ16966.1 hypothetical protein FAZ22_18125 [Bacillus velezensis]WFO92126.1 hypothetical protein JEQ23_05270 [Bacillus velezensis]WFO96178.1 hypothetical protein JEQ24_04975 [Bacillus velezensis]WGK54129.1 hypothetical protein PO847_04645 [Bacillus velezensis]
MGHYYISTCHDCKETVMWSKCPEGWAKINHNTAFGHFHKGHDIQLFGDYDDESYSRAHSEEYHYFGIMDTDEFEKAMHDFKMSKEIKIWCGDKILYAFDKKDVVDIVKSSSGVSRIEVADGSWFEVDKTVEYMKEILGVEEMK